jgi:VIT1/CCC1 family predicted Fe2+/Mn2+ transporter
MRHRELHRTERIGWLRAAVLGANDGIVSTASLVVGVAAANANPDGGLSMAAGEYGVQRTFRVQAAGPHTRPTAPCTCPAHGTRYYISTS